jgi:calmodulin
MESHDIEHTLRDQIAYLRAAFDHFDTDGDGRLDAAELHAALRSLGHEVGADELRKLIAAVDQNGNQQVEFPEFVDLVEPPPVGEDPEADLRTAFAVLDRDGDGFLSHKELEAAGEPGEIDATVAARIVQSVDADGDGRISFDEFTRWMTR